MLIGRKTEQKELIEAYRSEYSEFVAITGRRRVGKTFLVRETFDYKFAFQHIGLANQSTRNQLLEFRQSLLNCGMKKCRIPANWFDAFQLLGQLLDSKPQGKKVVFIDELPWMDAPRSNFVSAVEHFWNSFASARKDILFIVCGSATSWIIKKVFKNHGGLHNRVTHRLHLSPFNLYECEQYARLLNLNISRFDILEYYMVLGGIPFYWSLLKRGRSVAQNIDQLFFSKYGALRSEYDNLYHSLFKSPDPYIKVIERLYSKKIGLTRKEIVEECSLANNGKLTTILDDLEACGFVRSYELKGLRKGSVIFQLIDNYSLFYFSFLKGKRCEDENFWTLNLNTSQENVWEGLAFERVCYQHFRQIKWALGISGVSTQNYAWEVRPDKVYGDGAQIDLVIDRADRVVNLCEIKFRKSEFTIDKKEDRNLRHKLDRFLRDAGQHKSAFMTLITPYGLKSNIYSDIIQSVINLQDLFHE